MGTEAIRRIFEPSAIRRGRLATSPVFYVDAPDGSVWRFQRKKDARAFVLAGFVCAGHERLCRLCRGYQIRESSDLAEAYVLEQARERLRRDDVELVRDEGTHKIVVEGAVVGVGGSWRSALDSIVLLGKPP